MKRRTFLTTASTIGIVSVASSATVVSSVYNDISSNLLLEEFDTSSKNIFNKFVSDITENIGSLGLDSNISRRLAMPTKIISNDISKKTITYKNKAGQFISISNGKIKVLDTV